MRPNKCLGRDCDSILSDFAAARVVPNCKRGLSCSHQRSLTGAPLSTSKMRARVEAVVSLGRASAAKKPCATISRSGTGAADLAECAHHEHRDVIAAGRPVVEEHAVQLRRRGHLDVALLAQLARGCFEQGLADLDPAARQMPAADIAVLDQKDAAFRRRSPGRARRASWRARSASRSAARAAAPARARGGSHRH